MVVHPLVVQALHCAFAHKVPEAADILLDAGADARACQSAVSLVASDASRPSARRRPVGLPPLPRSLLAAAAAAAAAAAGRYPRLTLEPSRCVQGRACKKCALNIKIRKRQR